MDALALRADERRDKLRKAAGRSTYPLIRRSLNGETHMSEPHVSVRQSITYGGEPGELKHLSSRRAKRAEPKPWCVHRGVRTAYVTDEDSRTVLGKPAIEGESPVHEIQISAAGSRVHRDTWNLDGTSGDHPVRLNTP